MAKDRITYKVCRTPGVVHIVIRESRMYATPKHRELTFSKPRNVSILK